MRNNNIYEAGYLNSFESVDRELIPASQIGSSNSEYVAFLYLDEGNKGFEYGQLITPQIFSIANDLLKTARIFVLARERNKIY